MKHLLLACVFTLSIPALSFAAQAVPTSHLTWDQAAPDLATAQAYVYAYYPDGAVTSTPLANVVCSGAASPFTCTVGFPAFTPGSHSLQATATNAAGESLKSTPFPFIFVVLPVAPANLRIT